MRRSAITAALLLAPAFALAQATTPAPSAAQAPATAPAPAAAPATAAGGEDVEAGRRVFNQCRACHTIDQGGRNGVGPNLFAIVGRRAGSIEGFRYSANMQEVAGTGHVWTLDNLRAYIRDPKSVVPRGTMAFNGIRNDAQLNNLLAYLQTARPAQ